MVNFPIIKGKSNHFVSAYKKLRPCEVETTVQRRRSDQYRGGSVNFDTP